MKVKTSELTGAALDWAAAIALGYKPLFSGDYQLPRSDERRVCVMSNEMGITVASVFPVVFSPSARWAQGGPIIERERICAMPQIGRHSTGEWYASCTPIQVWTGPTPLIAAMRCFVAGKLGYEVDIPEELL